MTAVTRDLLDVVDDQDRWITTKYRDELVHGDIIRVASLWVEDTAGSVLLARRSLKKRRHPGLWGAAADGSVEHGETYADCMIREAAEEIGLEHVDLQDMGRVFLPGVLTEGWPIMIGFFRAVVEIGHPITHDPVEVHETTWIQRGELWAEVETQPERYVPAASLWSELFS